MSEGKELSGYGIEDGDIYVWVGLNDKGDGYFKFARSIQDGDITPEGDVVQMCNTIRNGDSLETYLKLSNVATEALWSVLTRNYIERREVMTKDKDVIDEIKSLILHALATDGAHHKQWYLEE